MRTFDVPLLLVSVMTALLGSDIGCQSSAAAVAGDSLGLTALNREFGILPPGKLTTELTLGGLKLASRQLEEQGLGVTAAGFGIRNRTDDIEIDFGFDWNAGDISAREVTDAASLGEIEVRWRGTDREQFYSIANRFLGALRSATAVPACLPTAIVSPDRSWQRQVAVAWFADGWISTLRIVAARDRGELAYFVQYRAFPLRSEIAAYYVPTRSHASCLPRSIQLATHHWQSERSFVRR